VASAADTVVVVVTAGWGDAVQANKAGLLEIADLLVVNKADRPGAHDARRDLEFMLDLSEVTGQTLERPAVMLTTATEGTGIDDLWSAIQAHYGRLVTEGRLIGRRIRRHRDEVRSRLEHLLTEAVEDRIADLSTLSDEVPGTVARRLAAELLRE
jgi:LAO/AO transport system kinase